MHPDPRRLAIFGIVGLVLGAIALTLLFLNNTPPYMASFSAVIAVSIVLSKSSITLTWFSIIIGVPVFIFGWLYESIDLLEIIVDLLIVISLVFILPIIFELIFGKSQRKRLVADFARIKKNHGNIDEQLEKFIYQYTSLILARTEKKSVVTNNWYYSPLPATRLINLADIVAIFGDREAGTYIILNDGTFIKEIFGRPGQQWQRIFQTFKSGNPFILSSNDQLEVNGRLVNLHDFFFQYLNFILKGNKTAINMIIEVYNKRKQELN